MLPYNLFVMTYYYVSYLSITSIMSDFFFVLFLNALFVLDGDVIVSFFNR